MFVFSFFKHLFLLLSPRTLDVIRLIISFALLFSFCVIICCYGCRIFLFTLLIITKFFNSVVDNFLTGSNDGTILIYSFFYYYFIFVLYILNVVINKWLENSNKNANKFTLHTFKMVFNLYDRAIQYSFIKIFGSIFNYYLFLTVQLGFLLLDDVYSLIKQYKKIYTRLFWLSVLSFLFIHELKLHLVNEFTFATLMKISSANCFFFF